MMGSSGRKIPQNALNGALSQHLNVQSKLIISQMSFLIGSSMSSRIGSLLRLWKNVFCQPSELTTSVIAWYDNLNSFSCLNSCGFLNTVLRSKATSILGRGPMKGTAFPYVTMSGGSRITYAFPD
jgi:hypothetical protein